MNKFVAEAASRPAAAEERFVPVESFVTDLALAGFDSQQHRLPISAAFSDAHRAASIANGREE